MVKSTSGGVATVEVAGGTLAVTMTALSTATAAVAVGPLPEARSRAVVAVIATIAGDVAVVL